MRCKGCELHGRVSMMLNEPRCEKTGLLGVRPGPQQTGLYSHRRLLAHLSRRLIGELIVYPWSGVRRTSSVRRRRPQYSNIFFSETAWLIKAKFYVEPPWEGGTIFCSRHLGHMTKMTAKPIYGKNPSKIFFSRTGGPIFTKLGM